MKRVLLLCVFVLMLGGVGIAEAELLCGFSNTCKPALDPQRIIDVIMEFWCWFYPSIHTCLAN